MVAREDSPYLYRLRLLDAIVLCALKWASVCVASTVPQSSNTKLHNARSGLCWHFECQACTVHMKSRLNGSPTLHEPPISSKGALSRKKEGEVAKNIRNSAFCEMTVLCHFTSHKLFVFPLCLAPADYIIAWLATHDELAIRLKWLQASQSILSSSFTPTPSTLHNIMLDSPAHAYDFETLAMAFSKREKAGWCFVSVTMRQPVIVC